MYNDKSPVDKLIDAVENRKRNPGHHKNDISKQLHGENIALDWVIELIESVRDTLEPKPLVWKYIDSQYIYELEQDAATKAKLGVIRHTRDNATMLSKSLGYPCVFEEDQCTHQKHST